MLFRSGRAAWSRRMTLQQALRQGAARIVESWAQAFGPPLSSGSRQMQSNIGLHVASSSLSLSVEHHSQNMKPIPLHCNLERSLAKRAHESCFVVGRSSISTPLEPPTAWVGSSHRVSQALSTRLLASTRWQLGLRTLILLPSAIR